jgi:hypothetical protein
MTQKSGTEESQPNMHKKIAYCTALTQKNSIEIN